jgi:Ni,Fe-hydrogenase III large subunit
VVDRIHGTGTLSSTLARTLALVGPVARASGIAQDVRVDRPYGAYRHQAVHVQHEDGGDVKARLLVKAHEVEEGCRLALGFLDLGALEARGARTLPVAPLEGPRTGVGSVESPRGEYLTWVSLDGDGKLQRVHIRDPSFLNWPAIEYAVKGNIVPDFPLCNKSLNLSYSGFDR